MKIQANELMIGDWVKHDREPYQIRQLGIYGVDRDGEDYAAVCVGKPNGVGLIVERNEIEPIPITTEILKKNGFKREGGASYWHEGDIVEVYDFTSVYANKYRGVVNMCRGSWCVEYEDSTFDLVAHPRLFFDDFADRKTEVVGNIYDNPEFLNKK